MGKRPIGCEFVFVQHPPLLDKARGGPWQIASDREPITDSDQGLVLRVDRMKVRRVVIRKVHVDHNPVELAKSRHKNKIERSGDTPVPLANYPKRCSRIALLQNRVARVASASISGQSRPDTLRRPGGAITIGGIVRGAVHQVN